MQHVGWGAQAVLHTASTEWTGDTLTCGHLPASSVPEVKSLLEEAWHTAAFSLELQLNASGNDPS
jgi:hypothetical protein